MSEAMNEAKAEAEAKPRIKVSDIAHEHAMNLFMKAYKAITPPDAPAPQDNLAAAAVAAQIAAITQRQFEWLAERNGW